MSSMCKFWICLILLQCCFKNTSALNSINFKNIKYRFATKTTYDTREIDDTDTIPWIKENIPDHLRPVLIDATLRHGTRFPSKTRVEEWLKIVPRFQQFISVSDNPIYARSEFRNSVLNWTNKFPADSYYLLSKLGWEEHLSLGMKYFKMMPELWRHSLHEDNLLVLSSSKVRALASASAFLSALQYIEKYDRTDHDHADVRYEKEKVTLEGDRSVVQCGNVVVHTADGLLRFFDHCKKYVRTVDKNATAEFQFENYFKSKTMTGILNEIPEMENKKDFYYIYQLCAFENALFGDLTWCHMFNKSHMNALEYASDLKHYYKTGQGYAVNVEQSCILLRNISDRIDKNIPNKLSATLRFGHAETLIPLVSLLGFFQNQVQLKADNFESQQNRAFRTGKISPFAGNLAIIIYESIETKDIYISFVINEYLVKPFGLDCFFCDFGPQSVIRRTISEKLVGCDKVCDLNTINISDEL